jgi:hypothetical protein
VRSPDEAASEPRDPIVEEIHRIRQELLDEFGGDLDALMDEANRLLLSGEYAAFGVIVCEPRLGDAGKAELDRRGREIDEGEVELIENDAVFAFVHARLASRMDDE